MIIQFFVAIWSAKIQTPVDYTGTNIVGCGVGALAEVIVQMMARDMFSCLREVNEYDLCGLCLSVRFRVRSLRDILLVRRAGGGSGGGMLLFLG